MKYISPLNQEIIVTLKEAIKNHPKFSVRMRAHAVLMNHQKFKIKQIANVYAVTRQTVATWLNSWESLGISSLFHAPKSGRRPKNSPSEKETIQKILQKTPHSPKNALSEISKTVENPISEKSTKVSSKEKNFRLCTKEIQQLRKRDLEGKIDLFYFDESGFSLTPVVPYAWQPIGEQLEIPSSRSNRLNILGFLNTNNQLHSFSFDCSITSDIVIECMNLFCK